MEVYFIRLMLKVYRVFGFIREIFDSHRLKFLLKVNIEFLDEEMLIIKAEINTFAIFSLFQSLDF